MGRDQYRGQYMSYVRSLQGLAERSNERIDSGDIMT